MKQGQEWSKHDYAVFDQAANELQKDGLASVPGLENGEEAQLLARNLESMLGIEEVQVKRISHALGLYEFTIVSQPFRKDKLRKNNGKQLARDFTVSEIEDYCLKMCRNNVRESMTYVPAKNIMPR